MESTTFEVAIQIHVTVTIKTLLEVVWPTTIEDLRMLE